MRTLNTWIGSMLYPPGRLRKSLLIIIVVSIILIGYLLYSFSASTSESFADSHPVIFSPVVAKGQHLIIPNNPRVTAGKNRDFILVTSFIFSNLPKKRSSMSFIGRIKEDIDIPLRRSYLEFSLAKDTARNRTRLIFKPRSGKRSTYTLEPLPVEAGQEISFALTILDNQYLVLTAYTVKNTKITKILLGGIKISDFLPLHEFGPWWLGSFGVAGSSRFRGSIGPTAIFIGKGLFEKQDQIVQDFISNRAPSPIVRQKELRFWTNDWQKELVSNTDLRAIR